MTDALKAELYDKYLTAARRLAPAERPARKRALVAALTAGPPDGADYDLWGTSHDLVLDAIMQAEREAAALVN